MLSFVARVVIPAAVRVSPPDRGFRHQKCSAPLFLARFRASFGTTLKQTAHHLRLVVEDHQLTTFFGVSVGVCDAVFDADLVNRPGFSRRSVAG